MSNTAANNKESFMLAMMLIEKLGEWDFSLEYFFFPSNVNYFQNGKFLKNFDSFNNKKPQL